MHITIIGIFLISFSIIFFVFCPKLLYSIFIFFIPFSATSIINFGSSFGIQPYYYLCLMVLIRMIYDKLKSYKMRETKSTINEFANYKFKKFLLLLILFLLAIFLSWLMPIIINGKIVIFDSKNLQYMPIEFTFSNLRFTLYLLIGVITTILIIISSKSMNSINYVMKVYILSSVFVALWGIYQLIIFKLNIPYPSFIFNNSVSFAANGYMQNISNINTTRISSVTLEPSIFAQYILTAVSILAYIINGGFKLFSFLKDRLCIIILILSLILSTSTTAYVGLLIIFLLVFLINFIKKPNFIKIYIFLCILLLCIFLIYFLYNNSYNIKIIIDKFIFEKNNTYSFQIRLLSIKNAWKYFCMYPILGVGWKFITCNDLIINLLANSGILGFVSFFLIIIYVLNNLIKILKYNKIDINIEKYAGGILCSFITLIFINCIIGFSYNLGHFWLILGMSISIIIVFYKDIISTS